MTRALTAALFALTLAGCPEKPAPVSPSDAGPSASRPVSNGSRGAIDALLDTHYPKEHDYRFGLKAEPGEEKPPIAEVVVFRSLKPAPHWHYITYGLTELDSKISSDPKLSGFGVEYTLRLVDESAEPPMWPINLLRYLAKRTWETHAPYDPGHSMNLAKDVLEEVSKGTEGLAFYEDEALKSVETPTGKVTFVQAIPLFAGEYELIGAWDAFKLADEIRTRQHDLLWRYNRPSVLVGAAGADLRARAEKEGSSKSVDLYATACGEKSVPLDALGLSIFDQLLRHRLALNRDAKILSEKRTLHVVPGKWAFKPGAEVCEVSVPPTEAKRLAEELVKAPNKATVKRPGGIRFDIDR